MDIWALALGAIIGWGCFVMPGTSFLPKAGPSAMIGLLLGGCAMSVIAFSYGYCIKKYPLSGGEFIYADSAFGKKHAFACGWMIVLGHWSLIPLNATAIAMITRYLIPGVFQFGCLYTISGREVYLGEVLLSSAFIVVLGYMNVKGIKSASWFQTTVAVTLTASVAFCLIGMITAKPDIAANLRPFFAEVTDSGIRQKGALACVIAVARYAPYCFVGFDCIPQAAGEYRFSRRSTRALMVGAVMTGACVYAALVFCTSVVEPWGPMMLSDPDWATAEAMEGALGQVGLLFLGIAMLCAVLSGMNAFYLTASRLLYSMSCADALPAFFGKSHPRYGTPARATCFLLALSLVCPWFGQQVLVWIVDITCVGAAVGFTYTCAAATVMARRDGLRGQTAVSGAGTILAALFVLLPFLPGSSGFLSAPAFLILFAWIALGALFWCRIRHSFLHGRWEQLRVEEILRRRLAPEHTDPNP